MNIIETRYYQYSEHATSVAKVNFGTIGKSKAVHVEINLGENTWCERLNSKFMREFYPEIVADVKNDPLS
jgi:hypothetical protein